MASSVKVTKSGIEALKAKLAQAQKLKLQVGWLESAKYDDGTNVAGIMAIQEFGSRKNSIPARPFMRPAIADNQDKWRQLVTDGLVAVFSGNADYKQVLTALGLTAEADIKNAIVNGQHAPLSPITIALRKHKNMGVPIGGKFVGMVAGAIAEGKTGAGELGDQSYGNKDPLRDTGFAIDTLTHEVT